MTFDIKRFRRKEIHKNRFESQIKRLKHENRSPELIAHTVKSAIDNISESQTRSFVIYGEPQSGKTEMMIALTGKLLDEGFSLIVVLLNDSLQLLSQNLDRFRRSGLDPTPRNFSEILDPSLNLSGSEWVLFSKKNAKDLRKLIDKVGAWPRIVVIDDEADYATPNAKVNRGERTKINSLIADLLGEDGIYIGVTATPARLDLNNTFKNDNERWIDFPPHSSYTGQDVFFPIDLALDTLPFRLTLLSDSGDDPRYLRQALFGFFVNVAYLNCVEDQGKGNYSMLIHTSGKKADHSEDYKVVVKCMNKLKDQSGNSFETYVRQIWEIAELRYPGQADLLTEFILRNIGRHTIAVMNSDIEKRAIDFKAATSPSALFTIAIGGNIVSRGVTFENLLSMFFTRDVKHKIQQDTYIQRARMFGTRPHLQYFELSIPNHLYVDWHKCFIFHRLARASIRRGDGSPVWLESHRVSAVASCSIDRATVDMNRGEMGFEMFDYDQSIDAIVASDESPLDRLQGLTSRYPRSVPTYLIEFIETFSASPEFLALHPSRSIANYSDADQVKIERQKGFIGRSDLELSKYPNAVHHVKIYYNEQGKARAFYKYTGDIRFLRNSKRLEQQ